MKVKRLAELCLALILLTLPVFPTHLSVTEHQHVAKAQDSVPALIWPVPSNSPYSWQATSLYGSPYHVGLQEYAIDIEAKPAQPDPPVVAPASGRISFAGDCGVVIDMGNNYAVSAYHFHPSVRRGDTVTQGQQIGTMAWCGNLVGTGNFRLVHWQLNRWSGSLPIPNDYPGSKSLYPSKWTAERFGVVCGTDLRNDSRFEGNMLIPVSGCTGKQPPSRTFQYVGDLRWGQTQWGVVDDLRTQWFSFYLDTTYNVTLTADRTSMNLIPHLILQDYNGSVTYQESVPADNKAGITMTLNAGRYRVIVEPANNTIGEYSLVINHLYSRQLTFNQAQSGSIEPSTYQDWMFLLSESDAASINGITLEARTDSDIPVQFEVMNHSLQSVAGATVAGTGVTKLSRTITPGWYLVRVTGDVGRSYTLEIRPGLENDSPPPVVLKGEAVPNATTVKVGETVTVDFTLQIPPDVPLDAYEAKCQVDPTILANGTVQFKEVFGPDPLMVNQGMQPDGSFMFAVSQSGDTPAVTQGGTVFTATYAAVSEGQTNLTCTLKIINVNSGSEELSFEPISFAVQGGVNNGDLTLDVPISGTVSRSHSQSADITVSLLDASGQTVETLTTPEDGTFEFHVPPGAYTVRATAPGHLSAEGNISIAASQYIKMAYIALPTGDINNDAQIDEQDAVLLSRAYGTNATQSDLDSDGEVGLTDLSALARNMTFPRKHGPIAWEMEAIGGSGPIDDSSGGGNEPPQLPDPVVTNRGRLLWARPVMGCVAPLAHDSWYFEVWNVGRNIWFDVVPTSGSAVFDVAGYGQHIYYEAKPRGQGYEVVVKPLDGGEGCYQLAIHSDNERD